MDQCQGIVDTSTIRADITDVEIYQTAVLRCSGDRLHWQDAVADDAFVVYIARSSPEVNKDLIDREYLPITYNYEKWVGGAVQRRVDGDIV